MTLDPQYGHLRILVADDHAISACHAVAALSRPPGIVRWSKTASEALDLALKWFPHLIFMDLHLEDANGLEVLGQIRERWPSDRPPAKIILATGDASVHARVDLTFLKIDHLLLKPVTGQQLRDAAGLADTSEVSESPINEPGADLPALFRDELLQRLPELDTSLSAFQRKQAVAILHQLIASAAMCGETRMESELRALDNACRHEETPGVIARSYHEFLETAREFIGRSPDP